MKKILLIICASILLFACSKKDAPLQTPAIDYSLYKPKAIFHSQRNYSGATSSFSADTTTFTYNGTGINFLRQYNGLSYEHRLTFENGLFTQVSIINNAVSQQKSYYRLNSSLLIDSNWLVNNSGTTQTSSYRYHANGRKDIEINDYLTYKNIRTYRYQNDVAVYSLNERISNIPSISPAKDSVVYEYTALPFHVDFFTNGMPVSLFGKLDKHLLKKATYYNQLNNNAIRQTMEYAYQTNEIGLITRKILHLYTHPGNVLMLADTTAYTYNNL